MDTSLNEEEESDTEEEKEKQDEENYEYGLEIYKSTKFRKPLSAREFKLIRQTIDVFCLNQSLDEQPCLKVREWVHNDELQTGYVDCVDKATREWICSYLQNMVFWRKKYRAWRMDEHEKSVIKIIITGAAAAYFKKAECFMKHIIKSEKEKIPQDSEFEVVGSKTLKTNSIQHCYIINEEFLYALMKLKFTVYVGLNKFKFRKCYN
jgi:hypothetical protein